MHMYPKPAWFEKTGNSQQPHDRGIRGIGQTNQQTVIWPDHITPPSPLTSDPSHSTPPQRTYHKVSRNATIKVTPTNVIFVPNSIALSTIALSTIALSTIALSTIALSTIALSTIALSTIALSPIILPHHRPPHPALPAPNNAHANALNA
jgi:hypothetical protein